jgi:hypothetical protein
MFYLIEDNDRSHFGSYRYYLYPTEAQAAKAEKDINFALDMGGAYHHVFYCAKNGEIPHTLEEVKDSICYLTSDWFKEMNDPAYVSIYDEDGNKVQEYKVIP